MKNIFKPVHLIFSLLIAVIAVVSCNLTVENFWSGDTNVNRRITGLKNLSESDDIVSSWKNDGETKYKVLVITDVHLGADFYDSSNTEAFFKWLADYSDKAQIKFALGLGDFTDNAHESEYKRYARIVSRIEEALPGRKVLNVIGNHDLFQSDGYELYEQYCYPHTSFYKFETQKLVWYGLDTGSGLLGSRQLAFLRQSLPQDSKSKTPVIFTHIPFAADGLGPWLLPYCLRDTTERNIMIGLFSRSKIKGYFCGHYHPGGSETVGNVTQYGLKSFGEFGKWYILDVDETIQPPSISVHQYPN